jgi:long-subunit fatty acid transport protein
MGGSYTAFEDDPVSIWLNPAGIATQPDQFSFSYQTYTAYPVDTDRGPSDTEVYSVKAEMTLADPIVIPSYVGFVFQLGTPESPMAAGICFARPYLLHYAMDRITSPTQTTFEPENEVEESLSRVRLAFARDFRIRPPGETGFLPHLAVGVGMDLGYETWQFSSPSGDKSDSSVSLGFGAGLLVGLYDNTETFKVNLGLAYQSGIDYDFSIEPDLLPAFDMPQQFNVGVTFYLLQGLPLRLTFDVQMIQWEETAESPLFSNHPGRRRSPSKCPSTARSKSRRGSRQSLRAPIPMRRKSPRSRRKGNSTSLSWSWPRSWSP